MKKGYTDGKCNICKRPFDSDQAYYGHLSSYKNVLCKGMETNTINTSNTNQFTTPIIHPPPTPATRTTTPQRNRTTPQRNRTTPQRNRTTPQRNRTPHVMNTTIKKILSSTNATLHVISTPANIERINPSQMSKDGVFLLQFADFNLETSEGLSSNVQLSLPSYNLSPNSSPPKEPCQFESVKGVLIEETDSRIVGLIEETDSRIDKLMHSNEILKKKNATYLEEISSMKGKIQVEVRLRPHEQLPAFEYVNDESIKLTIKGHKLSNGGSSFTCNKVHAQDASQESVFEGSAKQLVNSCLDGFNGCIVTYGQTGSGKTYTMEGTIDNRGITLRAINEILKAKVSSTHEFNVTLTCVEIYNGTPKDLLNVENKHKLRVRSGCQQICIDGLRELSVTDLPAAEKILMKAYANRTTRGTNLNTSSSRSHAIYIVTIRKTDATSQLVLVDLAGSERTEKTGTSGDGLKEGNMINKSLLTLGNVMNALQKKQRQQQIHIPYRDSKLTEVLYPCLSGNAKVLIITNVASDPIHILESLRTLEFAERAKQLEFGKLKRNKNHNSNNVPNNRRKKKKNGTKIKNQGHRIIVNNNNSNINYNTEKKSRIRANHNSYTANKKKRNRETFSSNTNTNTNLPATKRRKIDTARQKQRNKTKKIAKKNPPKKIKNTYSRTSTKNPPQIKKKKPFYQRTTTNKSTTNSQRWK